MPLSQQALELLEVLSTLTGKLPYCFPKQRVLDIEYVANAQADARRDVPMLLLRTRP